jgi:arabinosyltransferase C
MIAAVCGLLGFLLAVATPLLPISQQQTSIDWPGHGPADDVIAPATMYKPLLTTVTVPAAAVAQAPSDRETVLFSTAPAQAGDKARAAGLFVTVDAKTVTVRSRGDLVLSVPRASAGQPITVRSDASATVAEVGADHTGRLDGDHRPQLVGLFTAAAPGAAPTAHVEIDSRYTSGPSLLKGLAMVLGVVTTAAALIALVVLDRGDRRRGRHWLPRHWLRFELPDAAVIGALLIWHVIGAPTSDDGYILGMVKGALHSGYMPEVFRYYDAPYAPFGMPFYLVAWMSEISVSSPWLRLPTLIAAIASWLLISREVLPRLGLSKVRDADARSRGLWAAAAVFTLFWLTYNPGLRPEPIVAFGTLVTWCLVERAVAARRLAPLGAALVVAGLTLSAAPTGSFAFAVILVAAPPLWRAIRTRSQQVGYLAVLAPLAACTAVILILFFGDHGLKEMLQSTHLLSQVGPAETWSREIIRYETLFQENPNGSVARRLSMLAMLLSAAGAAVMLLRRRHIPGLASGPAVRVLGAVAVSLLLMMFNPTKWTHHFGAFATLAAMAAAIGAVAITPATVRRPQWRLLFLAAVCGIAAASFESTNGWFYPGNFGIPWGGAAPTVAGIKLATLFGAAAVVLIALAVAVSVTGDDGGPARLLTRLRPPTVTRALPAAVRGFATPVTLVATFTVLMIDATNAAALYIQFPAYSYGLQNLRALSGRPCGAADEVLVEKDTNAAQLTPVAGPPDQALGAGENENFTPNGVATDLTAVNKDAPDVLHTGDALTTASNTGGTGGGTLTTPGLGGSTAALPFGLDPARTPVLGSLQTSEQKTAKLVSGWYRLPPRSADAPLLVLSAAGRFNPGDVTVEFGADRGHGFETVQKAVPIDIGPAPAWRNLRVPLAGVPTEATVARITASVTAPSDRQWTAVTPPRVPHLTTLQQVVGDDATLVDWGSGIAFPCQRQWREFGGIAELPKWRIQPERQLAAAATTTWEGGTAGGPLGWMQLLASPDTVATYFNHDWGREWGALERYVPYTSAQPATVTMTEVTRSGWWSPGPTPRG